MINEILQKLEHYEFTLNYVTMYPQKIIRIIFHSDKYEGDKLVFNQDFFNVDKKMNEIFEFRVPYYTAWDETGINVYHQDSHFAEPKFLQNINRDNLVKIMDKVNRKIC